jgi:hypothetical protein
MKHILLIAFMAILGTGSVYAQKNTIVGKWKFASLSTPDFSMDIENPASTKKFLLEEIKKEGGQAPDSATLEMAVNMMSAAFKSMSFEFTESGDAIFIAPDEDGGTKAEKAKYTVDYAKGTFTTIETVDGKEKKETIKISFNGDYMTMENVEKKEVIKVKRDK